MRALEIAEFHQSNASVGRTLGRIPLNMGLLAVRRKGVGGHVVHFAAQKRLAVLAHKDLASLNLLAQRHLNGNHVEIRRDSRAERTQRNFDVVAPTEEMADEY